MMKAVTNVPLLRLAVVLVLAWTGMPGAAQAQDDLLASIYTDGGFEVRRDERLFTLFSAFNSAGYDRAMQTRTLPFPKSVRHPIRDRLGQALAPFNGNLGASVNAYLDAHPQPLGRYVEAALRLGEGPGFAPAQALPKSLAGLDGMLASYAKASNSAVLLKGLATSYRDELKRVADTADAPFLALRAAYRLNEDEAPMLVLMPNPLDAPDSVFATSGDEDTHFVVLGLPAPEVKLDLAPALAAYSELLAREEAKKTKRSALEVTVSKLVALRRLEKGADAEQIVAKSLHAAMAAKLWSKTPDADVDAAVAAGWVLARSFYEALAAPVDSIASSEGSLTAQVVAKFNLEKAILALDRARK